MHTEQGDQGTAGMLPEITLMKCATLSAMRGGIADAIAELWRRDPFSVRRVALIYASVQSAQMGRWELEARAATLGLAAYLLPEIVTPRELWDRLAGAAPQADPILREALLEAEIARLVRDGLKIPFQVHPGLQREIVSLADEMSDNDVTIARLERECIERFGGSVDDPGAERMEMLSRLVTGAIRGLESSLDRLGLADPAAIRRIGSGAPCPYEIVHAAEPVSAADMEALARLSGCRQLTLWATARECSLGYEERIRQRFSGVVVRTVEGVPATPRLLTGGAARCFLWRDREEDLLRTALLIKLLFRAREIRSLSDVAVVFSSPLPYVYLARQAFRTAGVPIQMTDSFPLSTTPWAGVVDLMLEFAAMGFRCADGVALLGHPLLDFLGKPLEESRKIVAELDRELRAKRFIAGRARWEEAGLRAHELFALAEDAPAYRTSEILLQLIERYRRHEENEPESDARARGAVESVLAGIARAYRLARLDQPIALGAFRALLRRWVEAHTFEPREGRSGVHLVHLEAARNAGFSHVFFVGMVAEEWPERRRPSILFPQSFLTSLGWDDESAAAARQRIRFLDIVESTRDTLSFSAFRLEADTPVSPSPFLRQVARGDEMPTLSIDHAALASVVADPAVALALGLVAEPGGEDWAGLRARRERLGHPSFRGQAGETEICRFTATGLERYLRCPFLYFASMMGIPEEDVDEDELSPLERGSLLHSVLQEFFQRWDAGGAREVHPRDRQEFERVFAEALDSRLGDLRSEDRQTERRRFFGTMLSEGLCERLFRAEAVRTDSIESRRLEAPFDLDITLDTAADRVAIRLSGRMDRVDFTSSGGAVLIDYKLGRPPDRAIDIQIALYEQCLKAGKPSAEYRGVYYAFGNSDLVKAARAPADGALEAAVRAVRGIQAGNFAPSPYNTRICEWCSFQGLCRKEGVVDGTSD